MRPGSITPELDARILVGHALSLDHAALAAAGARVLDASESKAIAALAGRRLAREPVARIVGTKEFWSLMLHIDSTTLVPRPETETVVEAALAAVDASGPRTRELRIADLGTGSGALLLALLTELPNATGVGTDTSLGALRGARDNARRSRACPGGIRRLRHGRRAPRPLRPDRFQSAVYRIERDRRAGSGGSRFRPAAGAGRRGRRAGLLSQHRRRGARRC